MSLSISVKASVKDVLLSGQSQWDGFYKNIKGFLPDYLWKYFDLDGDTVFVDPIPPVEPVIEAPPEATSPTSGPTTRSSQPQETSEHQASRELRHKEDMDMYFKSHIIYRDAKKGCEYYQSVQTKLQDKIQAKVVK